jgi:hypothetical protein
MKYGGTLFPVADTAKATVTSGPLSADDILPTYRTPRRAITRSGFCTVVTPVSSMFQTSAGPHLRRFNTICRLSKKAVTLVFVETGCP